MTVETTVFADANPAAIAAFGSIPAFRGRVHRFAPGTPHVATPPFGLLAVRDAEGVCLDLVDSFGVERNPGEADLADGRDGVLPRGVVGADDRGPVDPCGFDARIYPSPRRAALAALRRIADESSARVWLSCVHERGDDLYDAWAWLFEPARPSSPAREHVFADGGDAGQILWQRDLVGPSPWRILHDEPSGSPIARLYGVLGLDPTLGVVAGEQLESGLYRRYRL
jgi:hypothetical protein